MLHLPTEYAFKIIQQKVSTNWEKAVGKFYKAVALLSFAFAHHNMITEYGYFVILEVFCLLPMRVSLRGVILLSFYFISVYSPSLFAMFCQSRAGAALYAIRPSAVFLARLRWYCWFHRASSSPLIVGSLVPGSFQLRRWAGAGGGGCLTLAEQSVLNAQVTERACSLLLCSPVTTMTMPTR